MGQIRIFNRPPKAFEFDKEDLVIDNVRGDIYYKDDKNRLQKIVRADDTSTSLSVADLTTTKILTSDITASGNISASGTIIANNFQSDGQDQITVADAFNITGSITSSGDISASGDVHGDQMRASTAYRLEDSGGTSRHIIRSQNNEIEIGNSNLTDGILLTGNITASGNISASGDIMASRLVMGDNIVGGIDNGEFIIGNNAVPVQIKQNYLTVSPGGTDGHITASGNISASGNMVANTGSFNLIEGGVF